ncbi:hypothetical protein V5799_014769 [Amblyomma americanum]|uniref:Uncharacterized protein n=1 Tax=Amblyomma americanum TaxID=6943 RepID=A0AAQ4E226_AMBAM
MDVEPQAQVDRSVVLVNRKTMFTIIAVLGVTMLGCACALAFSLSNYNILKRNDADVRSYRASLTKASIWENGNDSAASDTRCTTTGALVQTQPAERDEARLEMRAHRRMDDSIGQTPANGSLPELARQESFDRTATGAAEEYEDPAADDKNATTSCYDVSSNTTEYGFAEAP